MALIFKFATIFMKTLKYTYFLKHSVSSNFGFIVNDGDCEH